MMPPVYATVRERILAARVALELFPHCCKCGGDLTHERLRNIVPVIGRERRHMHHCCPRPTTPAVPAMAEAA